MCAPIKASTENTSHHAIGEIISGMSALNMMPSPIPIEKQTPDNNGFLTDVDHWARHSMEHFHESIQSLRQTADAKVRIQMMIFKLAEKLRTDGKMTEEYEQMFDSLFEQTKRI